MRYTYTAWSLKAGSSSEQLYYMTTTAEEKNLASRRRVGIIDGARFGLLPQHVSL
jgi:hypothetical protein